MSIKKKTGIVMVLCCMAAIAAVVWYCLLSVSRGTSHMDGTFVLIPPAVEVREAAVGETAA